MLDWALGGPPSLPPPAAATTGRDKLTARAAPPPPVVIFSVIFLTRLAESAMRRFACSASALACFSRCRAAATASRSRILASFNACAARVFSSWKRVGAPGGARSKHQCMLVTHPDRAYLGITWDQHFTPPHPQKRFCCCFSTILQTRCHPLNQVPLCHPSNQAPPCHP
eukprot:363244-Chlamydomonas_euryale.AAC.2